MSHDPVVIVSAARTPMGDLQGVLADLTGPQLGGYAIEAAVARAKIQPESIEQVLMGCVLQAGLGQAPARQTALRSGLPNSVTCSTIHKV